MLYIPQPSISDLEKYTDLIKDKILSAVKKSTIKKSVKKYLDEKKIKEIISDEPNKLISHNNKVMTLLVPGFKQKEFSTYVELKNKRGKNHNEKKISQKYKITEKLKKIFNYDDFISSSKSTSYSLALILNRNTCTYCNRLYTSTVIVKDSKTLKVNNEGRLVRPQFDHWYAKSKFPILALSFFNLIPSCNICNSSIKGNKEFSLKTHMHPYIKEIGQNFRFSYDNKTINQKNIIIKVNKKLKIATLLDEFKIEKIYNAHSELELKDILDLKYKYSEDYLDSLLNNTFDSLKVSKDDAYRLIFGAELKEENFHKRPFSKFKRDILKELGVKI